jgi:heptosyltransferase-2/heptosyltransferase-3
MTSNPRFKKLLVIRLGALGDLVHVSASLNAIKERYPGLEIHFLSRTMYQDLVGMIPSVTQFWVWPQKPGIKNLFSLAQKLRQSGIDGVVNLQPSLKTYFLTCILGQRKAVYKKEKCKVFGERQRSISRLHAVEDFYRVFQSLLGLEVHFPELIPLLSLPASHQASADLTLKSVFRLGVVPSVGGKRANRAWPVEYWVRLLAGLLKSYPHLELAFFGGKEDTEQVASLINQILLQNQTLEHVDRLKNYCGQQDIPGTASLMQLCNLVISGDTGPLHLAAGIGVPVLGLFGPTSVARTGPRGKNTMLTLTPSSENSFWPCEKPSCLSHSTDEQACMKSLSVETVLEVLKYRLQE